MKLYKIPTAPPGERFHSSKTGLKDFIEIETPKDGRAAMADWLNDHELELTNTEPHASKVDYGGYAGTQLDRLDPLQEAELRAVAAQQQGLLHYDYKSPFSARTVLASIDAAQCAKAVSQFHGDELVKVTNAVVQRITQLVLGGINGTT